jgi:hypothetical protein
MPGQLELFSTQSPLDAPLELDQSLTVLRRSAITDPAVPEHSFHSGLNLLIREYSPGSLQAPADVLQTTRIAEHHFKVLRELGISVVSHKFEPKEDLRASLVRRRTQTAVAYGAAYFVHNSTALSQRQDIRQTKRFEELIHRPLYKYLGWVTLTEQPYVLKDIYRSSQYSIDHDSHALFLHDIDPMIEIPSTENLQGIYEQANSMIASNQ